jgi:S-DNA-T family DNA segregation ATPase FtsK/SpoIIIE
VNSYKLIGAVGATTLRERLTNLDARDGIARFLLDRLTGRQVAAIVFALLADPETASKVKIAIPRALVEGLGVPDDAVTDERTVALRHAACDRPALLIANTDDDQGASLHDVTLLGVKQLIEQPRLWVASAGAGLGLPEEQLSVWESALKGLVEAEDWTLHQVSHYVELTRRRIADESRPLLESLGWALPALRLPRDSGYFMAIKEKEQQRPSRWKKLFEKLVVERRALLMKQRPPRQIIEAEELRTQFNEVRDDLPPHTLEAIEAFISAPPGPTSPPNWPNTNGRSTA